MLSYFSPGIQPDPQALRNGAIHNDDGHGFAIVAGDRLIVERGLDYNEVIDKFVAARAEYPDGPALFHSRMGTAGSYGLFNVHPFAIGGDEQTVMAHNGIFPKLVQPEKGDPRCDTRVTAEDLLEGMDLSSDDVRDQLGKWMGTWNKVVILTVNPAYNCTAWIINEKSGIWDDDTDIWYSNGDYRNEWAGYVRHYRSTFKWAESKYTSAWNDDEKYCPYCVSSNVEDGEHCVDCDSCIECAEAWDDCVCLEYAQAEDSKRPKATYTFGKRYSGPSEKYDAEDVYDREEDEERQARIDWWEDAEIPAGK